MGKIEENKRRKWTALMDSAYELFTTVGFARTTISNIAHKAGVAKGTFYLYFEDKGSIRDELIRLKASTLLLSACDSMDEHMRSNNTELTVTDKFIYIINYLIDRVAEDTALLMLVEKNLAWGLFREVAVGPESSSPAKAEGIQDRFDFVAYIRGMLRADGVEIHDLRQLMFTLIDMINSTCYDALMYEEPVKLADYRNYLNRCIRLLVNDALA